MQSTSGDLFLGTSYSVFVGPMKAGTTWIHKYLSISHEVCLPTEVKETFYFDRNFRKGDQWYLSHFPKTVDQAAVLLEVAPSYFPHGETPGRIMDFAPSASIIITLRHPSKRAWSHYLHLRRYGYTTKSLREAALEFPELLGASCYNQCISRWVNLFGRDNVHILWQEDMIHDLDSYAKRICQILGIEFVAIPEQLRVRANEAAVAPNSTVAALGRRLSYALRDRRLYAVINFAKKLGFNKYFFGTPGSAPLPELTEEDSKWLDNQLLHDYSALPERYRHPLVVL